MNWKKRKKRRKMAKHYGWDHWAQFNKYMKFLIKTPVSRYIVNNREEFTWREVLDATNKICDAGGRPEKKMTEFEFWRAIREELNRMHAIRDKKIIHWIGGEMQSKAIEDFGDITQEDLKPSFSIQVVGKDPKPSFSVRSLSEQAANPPLNYHSKMVPRWFRGDVNERGENDDRRRTDETSNSEVDSRLCEQDDPGQDIPTSDNFPTSISNDGG